MGGDRLCLFEAWKWTVPDEKGGAQYLNTRSDRLSAVADVANRFSLFGRDEEDDTPLIVVVVDESHDRYGTDDEKLWDDFAEGRAEAYGVGLLTRSPDTRRFLPASETFTWGRVASPGQEGIYTDAARIPDASLRRRWPLLSPPL
ncbi:hypothetical protein [Streptomyces nanshensis]|nr:hypothetical protein [Streptomyces nanshensis]